MQMNVRCAGETTLVAAPGDVTGPVTASGGVLLRWNVGCGNVHAPHMTVLEQLEQTAQDGRLSRDLQFTVAGWRVTNRAGRIKRSYVVRVRPTATQLPVHPTLPTGSPVVPVTPSASPRPTDYAATEPGWDGLQPSGRVTDAPVRGRTSPLPPGVTPRPAIGATTAKSGASSSVGGAPNSWLTVASSVLALTVVTLPTVDRTWRRTSTDDETTATTTAAAAAERQAASKDQDAGDRETWSATHADRGDGRTARSTDGPARDPAADGDDPKNQSTAADSTAATILPHRPRSTLPARVSPSASPPPVSDAQTTTVRWRKWTRRPRTGGGAAATRKPTWAPPLSPSPPARGVHRDPLPRPRHDLDLQAPLVRRRLGRVVVDVGHVLLHRVASDTFFDLQVWSPPLEHMRYKPRRVPKNSSVNNPETFFLRLRTTGLPF